MYINNLSSMSHVAGKRQNSLFSHCVFFNLSEIDVTHNAAMLSVRGSREGRGVLDISIKMVCYVRACGNDPPFETTQPTFSVGPSLFTGVYVFSGDYWYGHDIPSVK